MRKALRHKKDSFVASRAKREYEYAARSAQT